MASLGKSNFSKLMSVLLSLIMVLSTMSFTLPIKVKAKSTVLWEENFDFELGEGEEYYDISTLRPGWVATIVDSDGANGATTGTFATNSANDPISWADAATVHGPKVSFEDGKVALKEAKNTSQGGSKAELVIPMTFEGAHPTTGYTVFEFDYYSDSPFVKNRSDEWSYQDLTLFNHTNIRHYARVGISTTNGIQDLIDSPVEPNDPNTDSSTWKYKEAYALSGFYDSFVAGTNKNNIRQGSDLAGKPVHMQIIYDLENMKYMICATVDGVKSFRGDTWMNIPGTVIGKVSKATSPSIDYFINRVKLQASEAPVGGSGDSVATYDNFVYTHYTTLPNFVSHNIADTADVNVTGSFDLTFDSAVDPASISAISINAENSDVDEEIELTLKNSKTVTVTYKGLENSANYVLKVPITVTNKAGLPVSNPQNIEFTTNSDVAPEIISSTVENNEAGVATNKVLQLTFSTALDPETVSNITMKKADDETNYITDYIISENNAVVTLYHNTLASNTQYTINIPATVKSSAGISATDWIVFTTGTYNADGSVWSQDFDAIDALSGDALDEYMAANHSDWTAQIGTAWAGTHPKYYPSFWSAKNFALNNATTGFKWSEAPTKYQEMIIYTNSNFTETTSGQGAGSIDFVNGRIKLGVPEKQGSGSTETIVTIPINNVSVAGKDYAVFEFDYYTDKMTGRLANNINFATGDIMLQNTAGNNIAKINISTTTGLSDIADLATVDADTLEDAVDNIGPDDNLTGKIVHFKVIFDIANNRYKVSATPEGGATMVRDDGAWISLPANVTVDGFKKVCMALKDYNKSDWTVQTFAEYDNIKITTVEGNPEIIKSSLDGVTVPIPVTSELKLYFTEAMDEDTLSEITLAPTAGGDAVTLTPQLSDGGKVVTLNHPALAINTPYTLTVPVSVTSALGIPMAEEEPYTFTTDNVPAPTIDGATITDSATNITLDKLLRFTFNQAMAPATASGITLKKQDSDVNLITGYEWSNGDTVVTLFHDTMEANATYTLEIPNTVVSASSGLPVYASYTFTTGDFATNVIWSENFDGLTEGRSGWTASITHSNPANGDRVITRSIPSAYTWADAANTFVQKVQFTNDKLLLTKRISGQGHGSTGTSATIPITTSSTPTSGYAVVEFDYMSTYFKAITASNHYNNDITLTGKTDNVPLLKLNIDRNYGVQDVLNPAAANTALTYATISAAPYVNNICSVDGLLGKKLHFQVVYDIENKKYMVSVTPEGGTRIVRNSDWIGLPSDITKIDFKQLSLNLKANSGSFDANAWYDNIKIWETSELPEIVTSTVEGNPTVAVDHDIVLRFTKPMNLASLNNITLVANETPVAVTPLLSNGGRTVLLSHPELETGATYTLTVPATVTSELGLPLAAAGYSFTTTGELGDVAINSATVTDGAKNIPVDRELTINFTGAVTEESVSTITLTKQGEETNLITDYTVNGTSVTLAHNNFDLSETYVLTVPAAVKSQASGIGITEPSIYTFTTLGEADVDVLWSENFDGRTAGNGDWSGTIVGVILTDGTINTSGNQAYTLNNDTENALATHFTWAEAPTKYAVNGTPDGFGFENGRFVINKYAGGSHGSNGITVTMPLAFDNMPLKDYAVFEFDYFTTSMSKRGNAAAWNNGDVILRNSDNVVIARLQMSKTNGIQDLLNPAGGNTALSYSDISGSYKENICEATDMENKTLHFKVVYDVENLKYLITMTPEGGAPIVRDGGWQSLPAGTKINFNSLVLELKEYSSSTTASVNSQYDNIKFSLVSDNPVLLSTSVDNSPEIGINGVISLTFDEPVYDASLLNVTIVPNEGEAAEITGVELSNGGKTATIKHKHFANSKTYTLTVPETVMSASGVPMAEAQIRTFTTDNVPAPTVAATVTDNATGIALNKEISVQLSEAFDEETIEGITLVVKDGDGTNLLGDYQLSEEGKKVTFAHDNFALNTQYVLTVPDTVKGVSGITVDETVYTFTTYANEVTATINVETSGVATDAQLQITFESAVSQAVAESITLSVKNGDNVTVSPTVTDNVVSLNNASLRANKTYVVTIPDGLFAENGVPVEPKTFEFATVTLPAPTVTTSTLAGKTTDVLLDEVITVTFSEPIVESTLAGIKLTVSGEESDLITSRTLSQDGTVVTLTHDNFTMNTDYVLTVPATIMGANSDLTLEEAVVYNFKTYESELVATINAAGNEVAADTNIQLTFTKDIAEDNISNIKLKDGDEEVSIAPSVSGGVISLINGTLDYETTYTVIIPDNLKSTGGIPVAAGQEFTFTTAHEGTLIWSEYFDGLTAENIATEKPYYNLSLVTSEGTFKTSDDTLTWADAEDTYNARFAIVDGKAQLSKKRSTWDGGHKVQFVMTMDDYDDNTDNIIQPSSGYTVFEYDYFSNALPYKHRHNEWDTHDVVLYECENSYYSTTRTYGRFDITSTYGIQDFTDLNKNKNLDDETNFDTYVKDLYNQNIRSAEGIEGQNVHMQIVYDINNGNGYRYMVFATVNGEKSYRSADWITLDASTSGQAPDHSWWFDTISLTQKEAPEHGDGWTVVTYDNFEYRHYTTLPSFVEATIGEGEGDVPLAGTIDAVFSKKIDPASISNITLKNGETPVNINVVMNGEKGVTINYSRLKGETEYTLTIPKTVTDINGLPLTEEKVIIFTTTEQTIADVNYNLAVSADKDIYNAGETVTADIVATGESGFSSYGFTFDYDNTALQLTNVTTALAGDIAFNEANGMVAFESGLFENIELAGEGTVVATATFKVLDASGATEIALTDAEMTPSGYDGNKAPTTTPKAITLYNIKVNFKAGSGVTLDGGDRTAYVKYGESTLYTDTTYAASFQIPAATADTANGWTLIDATRYWKNNGNTLTADEIRAVVYTASVTYTATAYKEFTVTVNAGEHGKFVDVAQTTFTATSGTMLGELELPAEANIVPAEGYVFIGWSINGGDPITVDQLDTYEVTEHMELVAQYTEGSFAFTVNAFENGEIAELSGVTNNKATYKTNVTFKVAATTDGYYAETVTCQVDGGTPYTLYPNASGLYTVPGEDITDTVTITVEMSTYLTMTFKAGTGTTMTTVTAYKKSGNSSMYSSFASLIAGTPDFDVPVPEASEGYRLPTDEVGKELWTDGETPYTTVAIAGGIFDTNKVFTAVAVQQYRVTFTASEHSTFAQDAETVLWVDYGTTGVAVPELEFEEGYVLKEWQQGGLAVNPAEAEITEDTEFVAVEKRAQYDVIVLAPAGVTITSEQIVDNKVTHGTRIQFTINDNGVVITGVTYQIGTGDAETLTDTDGVYTIPFDVITDTVTITITKADSFTVTFETDGNGTVSPADVVVTAGEKIAEEPAITPEPGYAFIGWFDEGDNKVELLEKIINGNVTYTAKFEIITRTITANGLTLTYDEDYNLPQIGKDVKFTVSSNNGVVTHVYYAVGEDERELLTATNGVYTIEGANITGNITITAKVIENATAEVVSGYYDMVKLQGEETTKDLFILKTDKLDGARYIFNGGAPMYWSPKYEAYVALVTDGTTLEELVAGITTTKVDVENYTIMMGDVNGNGLVTAADAGIVNDCLHKQRQSGLSDKQILAMDVEWDAETKAGYQVITTGDIERILWIAVNE